MELENFKGEIKENQQKIKFNKQLPYLVGNIVEPLFLLCGKLLRAGVLDARGGGEDERR